MTTTDNPPVSVSSPSSPAAPGSTQRFTRRPSTRGVQLEDVLTAADEIVAKGQKPTIERVRQHLGSGSPNTVSPMLDVWFERLPQRLVGMAAPQARPQLDGPPLAVLQAAEQFWDKNMLQHNPGMPDGLDVLRGLLGKIGPEFRYEQGAVMEQGDLVMVHGRYTGWGPKPMVAVDIFRIENGKVVEHWDVMQEEVPADKSANGHAMFPA